MTEEPPKKKRKQDNADKKEGKQIKQAKREEGANNPTLLPQVSFPYYKIELTFFRKSIFDNEPMLMFSPTMLSYSNILP